MDICAGKSSLVRRFSCSVMGALHGAACVDFTMLSPRHQRRDTDVVRCFESFQVMWRRSNLGPHLPEQVGIYIRARDPLEAQLLCDSYARLARAGALFRVLG